MMQFSKSLTGVVVVATALVASVSSAAAFCEPTDSMRERLTEKYHERVTSRGLAANGHVVEVWVSEDGSSWTITHSDPNSVISCAMASGGFWERDTKPVYDNPNEKEG